MRCPNCGTDNKETATFCKLCGTNLHSKSKIKTKISILVVVIIVILILCGIIATYIRFGKYSKPNITNDEFNTEITVDKKNVYKETTNEESKSETTPETTIEESRKTHSKTTTKRTQEYNSSEYLSPHSNKDNAFNEGKQYQFNVEKEVEHIRYEYNEIEGNIEEYKMNTISGNNIYKSPDSSYIKIISSSNHYQDLYFDREYTTNYYYCDEELFFVFVYCKKEEYRFYIKDGLCIRFINDNKIVKDYPSGVNANDISEMGIFVNNALEELVQYSQK